MRKYCTKIHQSRFCKWYSMTCVQRNFCHQDNKTMIQTQKCMLLFVTYDANCLCVKHVLERILSKIPIETYVQNPQITVNQCPDFKKSFITRQWSAYERHNGLLKVIGFVQGLPISHSARTATKETKITVASEFKQKKRRSKSFSKLKATIPDIVLVLPLDATVNDKFEIRTVCNKRAMAGRTSVPDLVTVAKSQVLDTDPSEQFEDRVCCDRSHQNLGKGYFTLPPYFTQSYERFAIPELAQVEHWLCQHFPKLWSFNKAFQPLADTREREQLHPSDAVPDATPQVKGYHEQPCVSNALGVQTLLFSLAALLGSRLRI
eukprot:g67614.t1